MKPLRTVRAEIRKLTSTKMPVAFLGVLLVIGVGTGAAVAFGTDMDGSKTFISTAADQQSLMAFAANALILSGLLGAVAVAREYGNGTVVLTFLTTPRRSAAVLAQFAAVFVGGGVLGLTGAGISAASVAIGLSATDYGFMVPFGDLLRVLVASALVGSLGGVLGAAIGTLVRNTGGAVTGAIVVLLILPPLAVQAVNDAAAWIPGTLANSVSGVDPSTGAVAALAALVAWAAVPASIALLAANRRDVT